MLVNITQFEPQFMPICLRRTSSAPIPISCATRTASALVSIVAPSASLLDSTYYGLCVVARLTPLLFRWNLITMLVRLNDPLNTANGQISL